MKRILPLFGYLLLGASALSAQELKHRPPESARGKAACVVVRVYREKDGLHYEYGTGQQAKGDLNYELAEEKLSKGRDCRVDIILDESTVVGDLKVVPKMAIDAGLWDIHVYVYWKKSGNMAEVTFGPNREGNEEVLYGPVQRFSKKQVPI
jgi:hypothetical protein